MAASARPAQREGALDRESTDTPASLSESPRTSKAAPKTREELAHRDLGDRLVHDLRSTAARNLERAGVRRSVAMKLTGHEPEAVYRRCAIVAKSDLEEGVAKPAKFHEEGAIR